MQRRLEPLRKTKLASATPNPITPLRLPIDVGIKNDDETMSLGHDVGQPQVADWTLHPTTALDANDDDSDGYYHGEIESHRDDESQCICDNSLIPEGYALPPLSTVPNPSTRPLVLVDLVGLCGYCPENEQERNILISQVREALLGEGDEDFDERVVELFDSGVATHVDSSLDVVRRLNLLDGEDEVNGNNIVQHDNTVTVTHTIYADPSNNPKDEEARQQQLLSSYAIVPYPHYLTPPSSSTPQNTNHLWKLLHTTHPLPVLTRLLTHLRNTSRSLPWKAEMHRHLRLHAAHDYRAMRSKMRRSDYETWRVERKERLEKLYEVRETFLLRVDLARDKYEGLVARREERVAVEMRRRMGDFWKARNHEIRIGEEKEEEYAGFYGEEICDDDGWGGAIHEDEILGKDTANSRTFFDGQFRNDDDYDEDEDENSNEEWSPIGTNIVVQQRIDDDIPVESITQRNVNTSNIEIGKLQAITQDDNAERRSTRLKNANQITSSHAAAMEEEKLVREKLKTADERIAEALLRNLEKRLEGVDNLLENLQEEEWAEVEEESEWVVEEECLDGSEMSLLDKILAMILGALSKSFSGASCEEDHYQYIKREHASIVEEWKTTFGRLAPAVVHTGDRDDTSETHSDFVVSGKVSLPGNDDKDWDEVEWGSLIG